VSQVGEGAPRSRTRGRRIGVLVGLALGLTLGIAPQAGAYVYWTNWHGGGGVGTIGRAFNDGGNPNQSFITGVTNEEPSGLEANDDFIYWANLGLGSLSRANLDGSGYNNAFRSTIANPTGVAINATNIFWSMTLGATNNIGKADLDGTNPNQALVTTANIPNGLAVNGSNIYWANAGDNHIARSDLAGGNQNLDLVTGATISGPNGMAVDSQHIYWANFNNDTIGRADLDGSNPISNFIDNAHTDNPCDVAVDGSGHLYWANFGNSTNGSIGRADISSGSATDVQQNFIAGSSGSCGVTADRFPVATSVSVSCSPDAVGIGQAVACSVTVAGSVTAGAGPTGAVSFSSGGGVFGSGGTCNLSPNSATQSSCSLSYSRSDAAASTINASYTGDLKNAAGTASDNVTVGALTITKITKNKKRGTASLVVHAPGAGEVDLAGKSLKPAASTVDTAGDVTLRVKTKGKASKKLNQVGNSKVKLTLSFIPKGGGQTENVSQKLKLVKK
jgi:virginiamycin B lyase